MRQITLAVAAALTITAALTGCAAANGTSVAATTTGAATSTPSTAPVATPTSPSSGETAVAEPEPTEPSAPAGSVSAIAQHIYDQCSIGAAVAGVRLTLTANPSGYSEADGHYQLIYPFTFLDGHDDPYAIYNCVLTDDTVTSKYISSGISDAH